MKRLALIFLLVAGISYAAGAMGHFHRSPHHHGHHHHHTRLTSPEEQKPVHS
jgi:hypothetical protein